MRKGRLAIAVIGEGITEQYYFLSLRDTLTFKPTPFLPKKSNLKELEIAIKECIKKGYSEIFCLIDKDNKIKDGNPDHDRNAKEYQDLKKRYHLKKFMSPDGNECLVCMVESYPSTEVFFLFYFGYSGAFYTNQGLKDILNKKFGYITQQKYFIKHSLHDLLINSGGSLDIAISASKKSLSENDDDNIHRTYTEIGLLVNHLLNR